MPESITAKRNKLMQLQKRIVSEVNNFASFDATKLHDIEMEAMRLINKVKDPNSDQVKNYLNKNISLKDLTH